MFAKSGETINDLKERGFYQTTFQIKKPNLFKLAQAGRSDLIDWIRSKGISILKIDTINGVAFGGHLELVKYLKYQNCFWSEWTCAWAAEGGHLKVLKWLREEGCPWDEMTCAHAAEGGHLNVLKWLREEDCPWDEWTAKGGHLEVLKWLREKGCPWDADTCNYAAKCGRLRVLKWLREEGYLWMNGLVYGPSMAVNLRY